MELESEFPQEELRALVLVVDHLDENRVLFGPEVDNEPWRCGRR
jgi:hypothetical protein